MYNSLLGDMDDFLNKNKKLVYHVYYRYRRGLNARCIEMEDAIQEGWITLYDVYETYDGRSSIATYAIMRISHKYSKMIRDAKAQKRFPEQRPISLEDIKTDSIEIMDCIGTTDDIKVLRIETRELVNEWICNLDERDKKIVYLLTMGKTQRQIAEDIGIRQPAVSRRISRMLGTYEKMVCSA